jgi:hypothetical protein
MGTIKVCLFGKLQNQRPVCSPGQDACDWEGILQLAVSVYFDNVLIASQFWSAGPLLLKAEVSPTEYAIEHWASMKANFEANSSPLALTPDLIAQRADLLNTITGKLEKQLGDYQHELYGRVLNELTNGSLHRLAVEVAGGKALLASFVTLGLARAVDNDDLLHAMLYGDQQLVDDNQVIATYALSAAQPISGANLLVNPRLVIGQIADQRRAVFSGLVDQYLNAITAKSYVEASDYVANTRRDLDLSVRIAQVEEQPTATPTPAPTTPPSPTPISTPSPTPPSSTDTQVYLPMVVR